MRLQISKSKNAESFYIVESIYVDNKRSNKIVKKLGTLDQIRAQLGPGEDPYEWGRRIAADMTKAKERENEENVFVQYYPSKQIELGEQRSYTAGYLFPQKIYHALKIPQICRSISKKHRFEYDLNEILSRLVYARILYPSSKRRTCETAKRFLEPSSLKLHQVYRALQILSEESDTIQAKLYEHSRSVCKRSSGILYYDCTNYFFETEQADDFRKYGFSKEHRPNPLVQMGLFMDGNGIPLAFTLSPGNTSEQTTLKPLEKLILKDFGLARFIVCTDAGLSSTDNRKFNSIMGRSFITTQSLKKLPEHLQKWALDPAGFRLGNAAQAYDVSRLNEGEYQTCIFWKERWMNENGLPQRIIVTYSPKYAVYQRALREGHIARAKKLIDSGGLNINRKGAQDVRRFIQATNTTADGEIAEKTTYSIDMDAVAAESRFDGFYAACTNLEDDVQAILKVMQGRWEIEECFRIMKSEFEARPVYLSREDRIKAHFLTCFMALLIYRIMEQKLQERSTEVTVTQILQTLQGMNLTKRRDLYFPSYDRTEMTDLLHEVFGMRTDWDVITAQRMRKIIRESKEV